MSLAMCEVKKGSFVFMSLETHVKDWMSHCSALWYDWHILMPEQATHTTAKKQRSQNQGPSFVFKDESSMTITSLKACNIPSDRSTIGTRVSNGQKAHCPISLH